MYFNSWNLIQFLLFRYFSTQIPKEEEEWINPFKCRKITIPKNDDLNTSSNSTEENKSQSIENEKITETNAFHNNTPNTTQKAFSWKSFSNNKIYEEKKYQKIVPHNSENDSISIIDTIKVNIIIKIIFYNLFSLSFK